MLAQRVDTIQGKDFQTRHLLLALQAGEPYRVARALAIEAGYYATAGWENRSRTAEILEGARRLAQRVEHPHALALTELNAGMVAYLEGRWKASWELAQRALEIFRERCTGVAWELGTTHIYSLRALYYLGELREHSHRLPTLLAEAKERDDLFTETSLRTRHSYVTLLRADLPDRAATDLKEAIELWSHRGFQMQHFFALVSSVEIALYCGDTHRAWLLVTERWKDLQRSLLPRTLQFLRIESWSLRARAALARSADAARERDALVRSAERDARRIENEGAPWGKPMACLIRAGVSAARRDGEDIEWLKASEDSFAAADMALHAAAARRCHGQLLRGDDGGVLVAEADAWMRSQGVQNPAGFAAMLAPGRWF